MRGLFNDNYPDSVAEHHCINISLKNYIQLPPNYMYMQSVVSCQASQPMT